MSDQPDLSYIVEALRPLAVPLDSLTLDPRNARKHGAKDVAELARVLESVGQDMAIVVQKNGMVVRKGNGRVAAARKLGWTHIAAVVIDEGNTRAVYRAITDNRIAERSEWDKGNLVDALDQLADEGMDLTTLDVGFDDDFVAGIFAGHEDLLGEGDLEREQADETAAVVEEAKREAKSGNPVYKTTLVFDDAAAHDAWTTFTRELKQHYPSLLTTTARVIAFIRDHGQGQGT